MINRINYYLLDDEEFVKKIRYNNEGYYIHQKSRFKKYKVTVVLPCFNAEDTIKKTINSVINQTIGFENIELIIVDDFSEDNSRLIILEYAKKHPNIVPVFLQENSGSPANPRNLGIKLASGKYITFIDSDDWFDKEGLNILYKLLEKTNDNYAIGKTIRVTDKGKFIIGEQNNWVERKSINPLSIKHIFHHLAPTARMMRTDFIKENNIKFPNMRYAEDKQFFIEVLTKCKTISTTDKIIYYANRYKANHSLTKVTTIFEKTKANINVIKNVLEKNLPINMEQMLINRLIEFDCITRLFNRAHFLKSDDKEKYFHLFSEVIELSKQLDYDFTKNFYHPWHRILVSLFNEEKYDEIVELIKWNREVLIKEYIVENKLPYYCLPFSGEYSRARITMLATFQKSIKMDDRLILKVRIFGDYLNKVNSLVIRQRNNDLKQIEFPIVNKEDNVFEFHLLYEKLDALSNNSYAIYIRYSDYEKAFIRMNVRNIINYNEKDLDFYTTIGDNFGLNINK